jgi:hypothetical protein
MGVLEEDLHCELNGGAGWGAWRDLWTRSLMKTFTRRRSTRSVDGELDEDLHGEELKGTVDGELTGDLHGEELDGAMDGELTEDLLGKLDETSPWLVVSWHEGGGGAARWQRMCQGWREGGGVDARWERSSVAPVNYLHEGSEAIDEGEQHISFF